MPSSRTSCCSSPQSQATELEPQRESLSKCQPSFALFRLSGLGDGRRPALSGGRCFPGPCFGLTRLQPSTHKNMNRWLSFRIGSSRGNCSLTEEVLESLVEFQVVENSTMMIDKKTKLIPPLEVLRYNYYYISLVLSLSLSLSSRLVGSPEI